MVNTTQAPSAGAAHAAPRRRGAHFVSWRLAALVLALPAAVPLAVIVASFARPAPDIWGHMTANVLPHIAANTFWLVLGTGAGTLIIGTLLGWLTGACEFPGRKFFAWALLLPLAVPTYVLAFIYMGLLDFSGPIFALVKSLAPEHLSSMPDVRSRPGVISIMVLALYPYVYLMARGAFLTQGRAAMEAARSLGVGPLGAFFRVALPMARPWLAGGAMLVVMESLADFGAVAIFNYDTFTTAIYKAWFGFFSIDAAAQLSSLLVLVVAAVVVAEQHFRNRMRFTQAGRSGALTRLSLSRGWRWAAFALCSMVFLAGFVIPLAQLGLWSLEVVDTEMDSRYMGYVVRTMSLGLGAGVATVLGAVVLSYAKRRHPGWLSAALCRVATLGYALPGTVLAVGIFIPVAWMDNFWIDAVRYVTGAKTAPLIQGGAFLLILAYMSRFMAAGFGAVDGAMQRITPSIDEAARLMGASGVGLLARVHVPMLRRGLLTGLLLVF